METAASVKRIKQEVRTVLKQCQQGLRHFITQKTLADAVLVDSETLGRVKFRLANGRKWTNWSFAHPCRRTNASKRQPWIRKVRPWGVDVASGGSVRLELKTLFWLEISSQSKKPVNTFNLWAIMEMNQNTPTIGKRIQHGDDGTPK